MEDKNKMHLNEEEWKKRLDKEQYHILREKGTEPPFSGKYNKFYEKGLYMCAACGEPLFSSDTKYDSGSGWPSFWKPIQEESVKYTTDKTHGITRVEVTCPHCGSHLGHVFEDGPEPTGNRYCINSNALKFKAQDDQKEK